MEDILTDVRDGIAVFTIANERRRNAISLAMIDKLLKLLKTADETPEIRVVIITGAGDVAFCSGHDLSEVKGSKDPDEFYPESMSAPANMKKPVIVAVNGHCYAAGLSLALACDLRVASENATFASPGAKLGVIPIGSQIQRLPRILPRVYALEFLMTAEPLPAKKAFDWGFLNRLTPVGEALSAALEIAQKISFNSPSAVQAIKEGANVAEHGSSTQFNEFERASNARLVLGSDAEEGIRAHFEKRQPKFENF